MLLSKVVTGLTVFMWVGVETVQAELLEKERKHFRESRKIDFEG